MKLQQNKGKNRHPSFNEENISCRTTSIRSTPSRYSFSPGLLLICVMTCSLSPFMSSLYGENSTPDSMLSISGAVFYYGNELPVDNVSLILSGDSADTIHIRFDGRYRLQYLQAGGEYSITPTKGREFSSLSTYDASLILQNIFQRLPLTEYQYLAADVTQDGEVSTLDASVILKYFAFTGPKYYVTSSNSLGGWGFHPARRNYDSLYTDREQQDFIAYNLGDLSGNWRQPTIPNDTIPVWFQWNSPLPGRDFSVKVIIGGEKEEDIFSILCALSFDRTILTAQDVIVPWSGGHNYTIDSGNISIAWAGDVPLDRGGTSLSIDFQVSPHAQLGQTISICFDTLALNEGTPWAQTTDAAIAIIPVPDISLSDNSHRFEEVGIGRAHDWVLTVFNTGVEDLTVFDILVKQFPFSVDRKSFTIPPGRSEDVTVTFTPLSKDRFFEWLTILSNDPDEPEVKISLSGHGAYVRPNIDIPEEQYDFGKVAIQGAISRTVKVTNVGNDDLVILNIDSDNPVFTASHKAFILEPDQSKNISITCSPTAEGSTAAHITITSNDPDDGTVLMRALATGVVPEAILNITNGSGLPGTSDNLVSVYLENRMKVGGVEMVLAFDSNVLEATEVSRTIRSESMGLFGADLKYEAGEVKLLIVDLKRKSISEGSGSVADFHFDVDPEAPPGVYPITLTQALVANAEGKPIMTAAQASRFIVTGASSETWWVDLTVTSIDPDEHPIHVTLGVDQKGTDGLDAHLDVPQAPRPMNIGFDAYFVVDHEQLDRLSTDFRSPEEGTIMWILVTQGKGGIVSWNHDDLPSSGHFIIRTSSLIRVNMENEEAVLFNANDTLRIEYARTVSVEGESESHMPERFVLFQNSPNPFNAITDIRYQIPNSKCPAHTTLKIYNIMGAEILTLVDAAQPSGYYTFTWDGKVSDGTQAATGVYFYRLTANEFTSTRKMLLLK